MTTTNDANTTDGTAKQRKRRETDRKKKRADRNTKQPLHAVFTNTERDVAFVRAKNPQQALSRHLGARTGQRKLRIRKGMVGDFGFNRKSGTPVLSEVVQHANYLRHATSSRPVEGSYVRVQHLPTYWDDQRRASNDTVVLAFRLKFGPWMVYDNPVAGDEPTEHAHGTTALEAAAQFLGCEMQQLLDPGSRIDDEWYLQDVAGNPQCQRFLFAKQPQPDPGPAFGCAYWNSENHREIEVTLNPQFGPGYRDGGYRASIFRDHPDVQPEPPEPDPPLAPNVMPLIEDAYLAATAAAKAKEAPEARDQAKTAKRLLFEAMSLPQLKRLLK